MVFFHGQIVVFGLFFQMVFELDVEPLFVFEPVVALLLVLLQLLLVLVLQVQILEPFSLLLVFLVLLQKFSA